MAGLVISLRIRQKLSEKHCVKENDILECFANIEGKYLIDTREEHKTDPETQWFIAPTDFGKQLKVVFMLHPDGRIEIKTAYPPNDTEIDIYNKHAF